MDQPSIFNRPSNEWSIVTYFADLLDEAESRFGPRLPQYTPIGIHLGVRNQLLPYLGTNSWYVVLDSTLESNMQDAIFFLSHEVIHLLSPIQKANCLEEGLATHFSLTHRHCKDPALLDNYKAFLIEKKPALCEGIGLL
jgi:hypothetical protein